MGAENRVKDTGEEGNRSLGTVLQRPVRYAVQAQSLAELETPNGFVNLVGGVGWGGLSKISEPRQPSQ